MPFSGFYRHCIHVVHLKTEDKTNKKKSLAIFGNSELAIVPQKPGFDGIALGPIPYKSS